MTLLELTDRFPDEAAARRWFERERWGPRERPCPRCGALETYRARHVSMPYRCRACGGYFSVRTGTALASSKIPLRTWAFAIWLEATRSKGISSVQLARDIGVTQKTAWFMLHRIRAGWRAQRARDRLEGPVEADETMVGGRERNKHATWTPSSGGTTPGASAPGRRWAPSCGGMDGRQLRWRDLTRPEAEDAR